MARAKGKEGKKAGGKEGRKCASVNYQTVCDNILVANQIGEFVGYWLLVTGYWSAGK